MVLQAQLRLKKFSDHTPLNNATYIILRHLPSPYKSLLSHILRRHSRLDVLEAQEGAPLLPNKIYYAPPSYNVSIKDGTFHLLQRTDHQTKESINIFLQSLAKNENIEKAIAIILSGVGRDGLRGVESIKKAGGLVIAQSPVSCQFPFMPQYIVDAGYADYVLSPEDMPPVIQGYAKQTATA